MGLKRKSETEMTHQFARLSAKMSLASAGALIEAP